ncbi:M50 family metallopeptidase [Aggregicoccus sp. 17bor-14]|uniref:M50 family metallopeptidase n=1 Tax=Myxococcaceae TaxID=31 RepID=UPI00129C6907|nr:MULTISPECIES: M50 family metallopeptidase [Myxococcaceae]MBF5044893.1 M50 family metallopeptidase [Simulacricoccus sp. 17bor-14]MRI90637.1 M50 family metallopeptidase [Aggregicoccus sp. 17bor-14]
MRTASGGRLDPVRLGALLLCLAVGWYFWDSPLLAPLKLLVVMMHESGHALATLFMGGQVDRVHVALDESGACLSRVPPGFFRAVAVYSAGYVGSAVAGALLLLATFRFRLRRAVLVAACGWLAAMGLLYAGDPFTLLFCGVMALGLALAARLLPDGAVDALNLFLAAFTALYALFDLRDDLWSAATRDQSDAALLAQLTHVPAVLWAVLWTGLGALLLALAVRACLRGGAERGSLPAAARRPRGRGAV